MINIFQFRGKGRKARGEQGRHFLFTGEFQQADRGACRAFVRKPREPGRLAVAQQACLAPAGRERRNDFLPASGTQKPGAAVELDAARPAQRREYKRLQATR